MDTAFMVIGVGAITLMCGAVFGPWGLLVLPAGIVLSYFILSA